MGIHSRFEITENVYSQQMCIHRKCAFTKFEFTENVLSQKYAFTESLNLQQVCTDKK